MTAPTLIFAIGNESRGDDALGPMLLRGLADWLDDNGLSDSFEFLEDFQLQVEHAMDMKDRQRVLFVDAGMDTDAPFAFYRTQASDVPVLYSHALAPEALLNAYRQFYREAPPDAFVLCVKGVSFELGEPLTLQAEQNLNATLTFAQGLLLDTDNWDARCDERCGMHKNT